MGPGEEINFQSSKIGPDINKQVYLYFFCLEGSHLVVPASLRKRLEILVAVKNGCEFGFHT